MLNSIAVHVCVYGVCVWEKEREKEREREKEENVFIYTLDVKVAVMQWEVCDGQWFVEQGLFLSMLKMKKTE